MPPSLPRTIGRYDVIERHGSGGMGTVYRARDPKIGRQVAIKVLHVTDEELHDRFLQEARSAGGLKHPKIVTVYDYGEHEGQPYIVMEFIDGVTLADKIRDGVPMTLGRKLDVMLELLGGLDYAHHQGVVHRDVKPVNIMEERTGAVKILDFGVARVLGAKQTLRGTLLGTPNYMSPEQVEGRPVDARSDIFAAGLVFYELLSYRQAFPGDTINRVMNAVVRERPAPLREICPDLDLAFEAIINKAIQKDSNRRYQGMAAMALDIRGVRQRIEATASAPEEPLDSTVNVALPRAPVLPQGTPAPTPAGGGRTPRPDARREQLSRRRAETIARHLDDARVALEARDFQRAIESAEQAALLDPDDERVISTLEQARAAYDEQRGADLVARARVHLDEGRLDEALALAADALDVDPDAGTAREFHALVSERIRQERERAEAVAAGLERGRGALQRHDYEAAIRAASEVLTLDPTLEEAHSITRDALNALEERRRQESAERAARVFVADQRRLFASGRRDEALAALGAYTPPHDVVSAALEAWRREVAEIDERLAAEARQREAEAHAAQAAVAEQRAVFESGQRRDAVDALERYRPRHEVVSAALADLRAELAAIEAREADARRVREQADRAARTAVLVQRAEFAAGRRSDAIAALERYDPPHSLVDAALAQLRAEAAELDAREAEARRAKEQAEQAARRFVTAQQQAFEAGRRREAIAAMQAYAPPHEIVTAARAALMARLIELEAREAEDRRRRAEAAAAAERLVVQQQAAFAAGQRREAIDALDAYRPEHEVVSTALVALRAELAAIEARDAEEAERRAGVDRAAHAAVDVARRLFADGARRDALDALASYRPEHEAVTDALAELTAEGTRLDEAEANTAVNSARAAFGAGRRADALASLASVTPRHPIVAAALDELQREHDAIIEAERVRALETEERRLREAAAREQAERTRRERELASLVSAGRTYLSAGDLERARQVVESALVMAPSHPASLALAGELNRAVEDRHRREASDRAAADVVDRARQLFTAGQHVEALDLLLAFTPPHPATVQAYQELLAHAPLAPPTEPEIAPRPADAGVGITTRRYLHACVIAEDALSSDDLVAAAAALDRADALVPGSPDVADLRRRVAERAARLERRRPDETPSRGDARRVEDQARSEWAVNAALQRARVSDAREAVEVLKQLLVFDPGNVAASDMLAERVNALVHVANERLEQGDRKEAADAIAVLERYSLNHADLEGLKARLVLLAAGGASSAPAVQHPLDLPLLPSRGQVGSVSAEADNVSAPMPSKRAIPRVAAVAGGGVIALLVLASAFVARRPAPVTVTAPAALPASPTPEPSPTLPPNGDKAGNAGPAGTAPTPAPAPVLAPPSSPATAVSATRSRDLLDRKDFLGAMQIVRDGLARTPNNADLNALVVEIVNAAEREAVYARRQADAVGGNSHPEYNEGLLRLAAATAARRSGIQDQLQGAAADFVAATGMFRRAAGVRDEASPTSNSPGPNAAGPTGAPSPALDTDGARQLLIRLSNALSGVSSADVLRVYPAMPADTRARFDQLRRDYQRCEYTFQDVQLVSVSEREAAVRTLRRQVCTTRDGRDVVADERQLVTFKPSAGAWLVAGVASE